MSDQPMLGMDLPIVAPIKLGAEQLREAVR